MAARVASVFCAALLINKDGLATEFSSTSCLQSQSLATCTKKFNTSSISCKCSRVNTAPRLLNTFCNVHPQVHGSPRMCDTANLNTAINSFSCDDKVKLRGKKRFLADATIWRVTGRMLDKIDYERLFHAEHCV